MANNNLKEAVDQEQKEFTAFLVQLLGVKDEQEFEDKMAQLKEDEIKELYRLFKTKKDKMVVAKQGIKLEYIKTLKGVCPEGTEKFATGGCVKCKKKVMVAEEGMEVKKRFTKQEDDKSDESKTKAPIKLKKPEPKQRFKK